jgi:hypothetical protein
MNDFKVKFNLSDYKDILPEPPTDYSEIINSEKDIKDQVWRKQDHPLIITNDFILQEAKRIKQGVWILIKGVLLWIPGNYYQFLQYGLAGGEDPQFRLKRLKSVYFKIKIRKDPRFIGTFTIKNRQDGETTMCMSDALWEVISGDLNTGLVGLQSKSREDAVNPCWFTLCSHWNAYPFFFKDAFYPHFTSGNNIAEKLKFSQPADPNNPNDRGKNVEILYGPAKHNAFDGKNNMRRCILDEVCKWPSDCSFKKTFFNYKKFIMPGKIRKGLFDILSSPADTNGIHNDEAADFWNDSDMDEIQEDTGSTKTRIGRYYSNPLDGIEGFYDEYGDCDPQEIYEHIMRERKTVKKEDLMAEVRGYPLPILGTDRPDPEQLFGSTDTGHIWINIEGIKQRKIELAKVKATKVVYGNYEWPNNNPDSGEPEFRQADRMTFDEHDARFCLSTTTDPKIELADLRIPPKLIQESLGVDPFNLRYKTKNLITGSLGAAISWKFRDLLQTGLVNYPALSYLSRPTHENVFFEDMIKAAIARRAKVQYENSNDKMENYFEDRGYDEWMIPSINAKPVEVNGEFKIRKGDAPSGKGATAFMNEGIGLINGVLNKPITPDQQYLLELFDFEEVLDDIISFNKTNTQQNHFTMALIQALLGANKLMFKKQKKKESVNNEVLGYVYS